MRAPAILKPMTGLNLNMPRHSSGGDRLKA
jgi:hypothetical protein